MCPKNKSTADLESGVDVDAADMMKDKETEKMGMELIQEGVGGTSESC